MVVILGITGGIASGKSTFAAQLAHQLSSATGHEKVKSVNADLLGHEAYAVGTACRDRLVERFGVEVETTPGGEIDRRRLGAIVFSPDDPERVALNDLNGIVWPCIRDIAESRIREFSSESSGVEFVVLEAAVMVQAGWTSLVDEIFYISADADLVVRRLMARNSLSREEAMKRTSAQGGFGLDVLEHQAALAKKHGFAAPKEDVLWRASLSVVDNNYQSAEELENECVKGLAADIIGRYASLSAHEVVCAVNEANVVVGKCKRAVMRKYNIPHRATYIIVHDAKGRVYVQKRSAQKDYCPSMLDASPGGVVQADESYEVNAQREMEEEMGIRVAKYPLSFHGTFYYADGRAKCWGGLFSCAIDISPDDLALQEEEVESVQLMSCSEIIASASKFMPDGMFAFRKFLELAPSSVVAKNGSKI